jgi:hypothetical protein
MMANFFCRPLYLLFIFHKKTKLHQTLKIKTLEYVGTLAVGKIRFYFILVGCLFLPIFEETNFKDFKRSGTFKGLVEQKNFVFNSFVCKLGFFGMCGPV